MCVSVFLCLCVCASDMRHVHVGACVFKASNLKKINVISSPTYKYHNQSLLSKSRWCSVDKTLVIDVVSF